MVVLGVLILLVFAVIVIATVARGNDPTQLDLDWFVIRSTVSGVFLAGALTLLLGVIGVLVLLAGLRRSRRRRAKVKELKERADINAQAAKRVQTLEAERDDVDTSGQAREADADTRHQPRGADDSFDSAPREP